VRFGNGGWTDNLATDALAMTVLERLGYEPTSQVLGLSVIFEGLENNDLDLWLDFWSPSGDSMMAPYRKAGTIELVHPNLTDSKYTFAVPTYAWEAGLKDFADLAKFKDKLDGKIYGQSPGSDSNTLILSMFDKNAFGLKDWELVESSEQGMLSAVARAVRNEEWIVFVGWAPHPMNTKFDIKYLSGGDDYFGPNFGSATVYTVARQGFVEDCPNLGRFLENLEFSVRMENEMMLEILDNGVEPKEAAETWLKAHPAVLDRWLDGVTTIDGKPGLAAVARGLGL
jgi:glycine betaine/proline transport system substrate-binding protein